MTDVREATDDLLAALGAQARLDGRPLRDKREYYRTHSGAVASQG